MLTLPVPTLAAQLSGDDLVLVAGGDLRDYDATTGALRSSWPLPPQPAAHDCDLYGDPCCPVQPQPSLRLTLGDLALGFAVYVVFDQVYVLRLADGTVRRIGPGTLARFADAGLVYADGTRIRLVPFDRLRG